MWRSLAGSNTGNTPADSPTFWQRPGRNSVSAGLTAATTQTQAAATALTADYNEISTCANSGDAVKLRTAIKGDQQTITNNGALPLQIFPNTSDAINGGSADAADTELLPPGQSRTYITKDTTNWYTKSGTTLGGASTVSTGVDATLDSNVIQYVTTTASDVVLSIRDATAITVGNLVHIIRNEGLNTCGVSTSGGTRQWFVEPKSTLILYLEDNSSAGGNWSSSIQKPRQQLKILSNLRLLL
jgi:hypothetical protein